MDLFFKTCVMKMKCTIVKNGVILLQRNLDRTSWLIQIWAILKLSFLSQKILHVLNMVLRIFWTSTFFDMITINNLVRFAWYERSQVERTCISQEYTLTLSEYKTGKRNLDLQGIEHRISFFMKSDVT